MRYNNIALLSILSIMVLHFRLLLKDNYTTCAKRDFIRHKVVDPNQPLPSHVISGLSGYAQNRYPTLPTQREVRECGTVWGGSRFIA